MHFHCVLDALWMSFRCCLDVSSLSIPCLLLATRGDAFHGCGAPSECGGSTPLWIFRRIQSGVEPPHSENKQATEQTKSIPGPAPLGAVPSYPYDIRPNRNIKVGRR